MGSTHLRVRPLSRKARHRARLEQRGEHAVGRSELEVPLRLPAPARQAEQRDLHQRCRLVLRRLRLDGDLLR